MLGGICIHRLVGSKLRFIPHLDIIAKSSGLGFNSVHPSPLDGGWTQHTERERSVLWQKAENGIGLTGPVL